MMINHDNDDLPWLFQQFSIARPSATHLNTWRTIIMNNHHEQSSWTIIMNQNHSPSWTRDPPVNTHSDIHPWILKATIHKWAHRCANLHVIASLPAGVEGWSWPVGRRPRAGRCRQRRRNSQCSRIPEMGKVSWTLLINKISSSSKRASFKHYMESRLKDDLVNGHLVERPGHIRVR